MVSKTINGLPSLTSSHTSSPTLYPTLSPTLYPTLSHTSSHTRYSNFKQINDESCFCTIHVGFYCSCVQRTYPDGTNKCVCENEYIDDQLYTDISRSVPTGVPTESPTFKDEATTWLETIISTIKDNLLWVAVIGLLLLILMKRVKRDKVVINKEEHILPVQFL